MDFSTQRDLARPEAVALASRCWALLDQAFEPLARGEAVSTVIMPREAHEHDEAANRRYAQLLESLSEAGLVAEWDGPPSTSGLRIRLTPFRQDQWNEGRTRPS